MCAMRPELSIHVRVRDVTRFQGLLTTLDRQTMPADRFVVAVAPDGLSPADVQLLERRAAFRPNVVVGHAGTGTYLLPLSEDERLTPHALELLVARAEETGAPAVIGKRAGGRADWRLFVEDRELSGEDLGAVDASELPVLVRAGDIDPFEPAARTEVLRRLPGAAVLASSVVLAGQRPEPAVLPTVDVTARWHEGVLELVGPADADLAVLRSREDGTEWPVSLSEVDGGKVARIDPATAAFGRPLSRGRWLVDWCGSARSVACASELPSSAVTASGLLAVVKGAHGALLLDVGATRRLPVRIFRPAAAQVAESAKGTRLRWPLDLEDLSRGSSLSAALRIGDFPVGARLVAGEPPALEAWLSGVPGRSQLSLSVAGSPAHPVGADLVIENGGTMRIVPASRPKASPSAKAAAPAARSGVARRARRLASRARRGLAGLRGRVPA
jgi:hypothetical protein